MNDIHDPSRTRSNMYSSLLNSAPSPSAAAGSNGGGMTSSNIFQYSPTMTNTILNGSSGGAGGPPTAAHHHPHHLPHPAHYLAAYYPQSHPYSGATPSSPFVLPSSPAGVVPAAAAVSGRPSYQYHGVDLQSLYAHQAAMLNLSMQHHQLQQQHHQSSLPSLSRLASSRISSPPSSHGSSTSPTAVVSPVSGHNIVATSPSFVAPNSRSPSSSVHSPEQHNSSKHNYHGSSSSSSSYREVRKSVDSLEERQSIANNRAEEVAHHHQIGGRDLSTATSIFSPLNSGCKRKTFSETSDHLLTSNNSRENSLKNRILRPPNILIREQISSLELQQDIPPLSAPPHIQSKDAITSEVQAPVESAPLSAPPVSHEQGQHELRFSYPTLAGNYRHGSSSDGVEKSHSSRSDANNNTSINGRPSHGKGGQSRKKKSLSGESCDESSSKCSPESSSLDSLNERTYQSQQQAPQQHAMCYQKGSVIQLANGALRKVEEMQTQDFLDSAVYSNDLTVDTSSVVKLEESNNCSAFITFAVGKKRTNFTVEAPFEHPFYVYNHGWSSCNPERSRSRYGLDCQKLKEGDIVISLTKMPKERMFSSAQKSSTKHVLEAQASTAESSHNISMDVRQSNSSPGAISKDAMNKELQPMNLMMPKDNGNDIFIDVCEGMDTDNEESSSKGVEENTRRTLLSETSN